MNIESMIEGIVESCVFCTQERNSKMGCCGEYRFEMLFMVHNMLLTQEELNDYLEDLSFKHSER